MSADSSSGIKSFFSSVITNISNWKNGEPANVEKEEQKIVQVAAPKWAEINDIDFEKEYKRPFNFVQVQPLKLKCRHDLYDDIKANFSKILECKYVSEDRNYTLHFAHDTREIQALYQLTGKEKFGFKHLNTTENWMTVSRSGHEPFIVSEDCVFLYDDCRKLLIKEATEFQVKAQTSLVELDPKKYQKRKTLLTKLLKNHTGVCIGERHSEKAPKQILIENMKKLYELGVRTLYLEHLTYDTITEHLIPFEDPSAYVMTCLKLFDSNFYNPGYKDLVLTALKNGIRVIPIDTTVSKTCGWSRVHGITGSKERYLAMNFVATRIIQESQKTFGGKYIALMGSAHVGTCQEVKGVADLLGCPSVVIEEDDSISLEFNVKGLHKQVKHVSAYLKVKKAKQC